MKLRQLLLFFHKQNKRQRTARDPLYCGVSENGAPQQRKRPGFTLLEIVVLLGIIVISLVGISRMFSLFLRITSDEKMRVAAVALANQKIETIRNLPYDKIGTLGGIPPGTLSDSETVIRNGTAFTVKTDIIYIDDPFDGTITQGTTGSIYNPDNPEVTYHWKMENNTSGQSPDIGNGNIYIDDVEIVEGKDGSALQFHKISKRSGSRVYANVDNNINIPKGRIGFWYKPVLSDTQSREYFLKVDTDKYFFSITREDSERMKFSYGYNGTITTPPLTWNPEQWYFIEAAWDNNEPGYRELWRDGVPLARDERWAPSPPIFDQYMRIGYRGDEYYLQGTLDELYILNNPYKYEIWGYNGSNPYNPSNPQVQFYWNLDNLNSPQNPQKGNGPITLGGTINLLPGVKNNSLEIPGYYDQNYLSLPLAGNIDLNKGRIGFWYKPSSTYYSEDRTFFNASGCNGFFRLSFPKLPDQNKLKIEYGSIPNHISLESQELSWNKKWWYLIEFSFDAYNNKATVYVNRQEVITSTETPLDAPTDCQTLYVGNDNYSAINILRGSIDELYILNEPYPESNIQDLLNTDYKRVKVTVSWKSKFGEKKLYMITDIAPPGIETTAGGGTIIIHAFDANGIPVPQADIQIINETLNPQINLSLTSNDEGKLIIPGAPTATTSYQIIVSKQNYSIDQTYDSLPQYPTPIRPHLSVLENQTTEISFSIDKVSTLSVSTVSQSLPLNWKINTNTSSSTQQNPSVANSDTSFYFTWEDFRDGSSSRIYSQKYNTQETAQWAGDVNISSSQNQISPRNALDENENQYIAWYDNSQGNQDIYVVKYTPSGSDAWNGPKKVNTDIGSSDQVSPDIYYGNGSVYLVWQDNRNDQGDIYFNAFDTEGNRLLSQDVKINTDMGTAKQKDPNVIMASDGSLYIAWLDNRTGQFDLYLQKIDLQGTALWPNEIKINSAASSAISEYATAINSSDDLYLIWSDNRNGNYDLWWQGVASTSVALFDSDQNIATSAPVSNQQGPRIAVTAGNDLVIGWHDDRDGTNDIYILKINPQGTLLWPQEIRFNLETAGDQLLTDLSIYASEKIIATWTDYRQTDNNAWAGTLNYDGNETSVPFVDFTLKGAKLTHQNPDKLKFDQSFTTDAQGTAIITGLEWDTYTVEITDPLYSLTQSIPESPFLLNPGTSTVLKLIVD